MKIDFENSKFVDKFTMLAGRLGNQVHLKTLRDAFATIMPLYILAGIAVLINNTVLGWLFDGATLSSLQYWGNAIINGTLNISGLLIAPLTGYYMAQNRGFDNPLAAAILSMATLVVMMPATILSTPIGADAAVEIGSVLSFSNIGTGGMFAGVIIGLLATELFVKISRIEKLKINLGDQVPPAVGKSFNVLIPIIIVVSGFAIISAVLFNVFDTNLVSMITSFIQEPLRLVTTGLWGCVILYTLGNLLWIFGIHQSVIYSSILEPLLIINMTQNMAAYAAGETIPNIINVAMVPTFGMMGGSGSTICLLIATFLISKNVASKSIAKMSLGPGLFNINEPVLFGYPIVYNIAMAIPFILVPALGIIISYVATSLGWISYCVVQVPWTTPPLLSAYLATAGDFRAVILQAIILVLGVLIYMPFVKINDNVMSKEAE